jgi:hypothetical protein
MMPLMLFAACGRANVSISELIWALEKIRDEEGEIEVEVASGKLLTKVRSTLVEDLRRNARLSPVRKGPRSSEERHGS